jgi:hypothetical protein
VPDRFTDVSIKLKEVPFGTPSFVSVSRTGDVQFFLWDFYENNWKSKKIETNLFIEMVDVTIKENEILIACSEKNSLAVHLFSWNLVDLHPSGHQFFYLNHLMKYLNDEIFIHQIKWLNDKEIIVKTSETIEKWKFDVKWKLIHVLEKSGSFEISHRHIYLYGKGVEILSSENLEILYTCEDLPTNCLAISPNQVCFAFLDFQSTFTVFNKSG